MVSASGISKTHLFVFLCPQGDFIGKDQGWQTIACGPDLACCLLYDLWGEKKCNFVTCYNDKEFELFELNFIGTQPSHSFSFCMLQQQSLVFETETIWLTNHDLFTLYGSQTMIYLQTMIYFTEKGTPKPYKCHYMKCVYCQL